MQAIRKVFDFFTENVEKRNSWDCGEVFDVIGWSSRLIDQRHAVHCGMIDVDVPGSHCL